MQDATQQDAAEEVVEEVAEEVVEEVVEEALHESGRPMTNREKALEEMYKRRSEEESSGQEEVEEVEPENKPDAPVWHDGVQWVTKVKVNGEEVAVPFDALKTSHQKDRASQERFQIAAQKEKELLYREQQLREQLTKLQSQPPQKDVEEQEEANGIVDDIVEKYHEALFQDDAVEAAKLLRTLANSGRNNATQNIEEVVNQAIQAHESKKKAEQEYVRRAAYHAELEDAVRSFEETYPDIAQSEELRAIADRRTVILTEENPSWTPSQIITAAAEYTREWAGSKPEVNGRFERKQRIVRQPKSVRASASNSKEEVALTPSEIVAEMRKARGQTL